MTRLRTLVHTLVRIVIITVFPSATYKPSALYAFPRVQAVVPLSFVPAIVLFLVKDSLSRQLLKMIHLSGPLFLLCSRRHRIPRLPCDPTLQRGLHQHHCSTHTPPLYINMCTQASNCVWTAIEILAPKFCAGKFFSFQSVK